MARQGRYTRAATGMIGTLASLAALAAPAHAQDADKLVCQTPQGIQAITQRTLNSCQRVVGYEVLAGKTINRYQISLDDTEDDESAILVSELGIPVQAPNTDRFTRFARSIDQQDNEYVLPSRMPQAEVDVQTGHGLVDYIVFTAPDEHQRIRFSHDIDVEQVSPTTYRVALEDVLTTYRELMPDRDVFEVQGEMYRTDCDCPSTLGVKLLVSDIDVVREEVPVEVVKEVVREVDRPVPFEVVREVPIIPTDTLFIAGGPGILANGLRSGEECLTGRSLAGVGKLTYHTPNTRTHAQGQFTIGMQGCDELDEEHNMHVVQGRANILAGEGARFGAFTHALNVATPQESRTLVYAGPAIGAQIGSHTSIGAGPALVYQASNNQDNFVPGASAFLDLRKGILDVSAQLSYHKNGGATGGAAMLQAHLEPFTVAGIRTGVLVGAARHVICDPDTQWHNDNAYLAITIGGWR